MVKEIQKIGKLLEEKKLNYEFPINDENYFLFSSKTECKFVSLE